MSENKKVELAKEPDEKTVEEQIAKSKNLIISCVCFCCIDPDSAFGREFIGETEKVLRVLIKNDKRLNIKRRRINFVALACAQAEIHFAKKDLAAEPANKISLPEKRRLLFKLAKWAVRQERSRYDCWLSKQKFFAQIGEKHTWKLGWKEKVQDKMKFLGHLLELHTEISAL